MFRIDNNSQRLPKSLWLDCLYIGALLLAVASVLSAYAIADIVEYKNAVFFSVNWLNHIGNLTLFQYALLTLAMLVVYCLNQPRFHHQVEKNHIDYRLLLSIGILLRVLLIPVDSYTSSDISRYLFDGKLAFEGLDPYRINHEQASIQALREIWQPPNEHAKYVTLYPPLALALFSLAASFGIEKAFIAWKVLATSASILTLIVAFFILKKAKKTENFALVSLSPLLIFESGIGGHIDSFSALFVATAILAWQYKKVALVGFCIALGTLSKLLPLALGLPIFFFIKNYRQKFIFVLSVLATLVFAYGLSFFIGLHPIGSIGVFFQKWRFGSPVFNIIEQISADYYFYIIASLLIIFSLIIAFYAYKSSKKEEREEQTTLLQCILSLPLILSPVVFPWYLMPLVPLAALAPRPWIMLWICLSPLSYEVLNDFVAKGIWQPQNWPLFFIALSLLFGVIQTVHARQNRNNKPVNQTLK